MGESGESWDSENGRFPYGKTTILSLGQFASNIALAVFVIYVPIFVAQNFERLYPDSHLTNTFVGIVMILDNIVAIFVQPYIGALSDHTWVKKIGRRMPFIIVGLPLSAFFLGLIGTFEDTLLFLLLSITCFNISMAVIKSPVLALIPDYLPPSYRSEGSGVLSVVGGFASISGLFLSAWLYKFQSVLAFWVIGVIMVICLVILIFNVHEDPNKYVIAEEGSTSWGGIIRNLRKEDNKALKYALIAVFCNQCGYQVAESNLSRYCVEILGFGADQSSYVLATLGIFGVLMAIPAGLVGKKIGARDAAFLGVVLFCLTATPLAIFSLYDISLVEKIFSLNNFQIGVPFFFIIAFVAALGFAMTLININLLVVIWNMASKSKIASYTGYYYLFAQAAAILSPAFAGFLFDLLGTLFNIEGLRVMFSYVAIMYLGAIYALYQVRKEQIAAEESLSPEEQQNLKSKTKRRATLLLPWILFGAGMRANPIKEKRLEQKQDMALFESEFKKFMREGDLDRRQYRQAIKALKREHKKEIKILKRQLAQEEVAENEKKSDLEDDLKMFARDFRQFMKEGDLSKRQYKDAIRALKKEHQKEVKAYKQELIKRRNKKRK